MYKASAPASLMLLGEHAVLHGKHALVCAVDKRMVVTLVPRQDTLIEIFSPALGRISTDLSHLSISQPFQFVTAALQHFKKKMTLGCDISIEAEFSDKVGLGSSAAVTVATVAVLSAWLNLSLTPKEMILTARKIVQKVQGFGSGADVAASVLGGIVAYKMRPFFAEKLVGDYSLTSIYSGYKTPTVEVVKQVSHFFSLYPAVFKKLCESIDVCVLDGIQSIRNQDWAKLGGVMNIQQGLMESLGVSNTLLHNIVNELRQQSDILGAKISGSGLGDCIVGLGSVSPHYSSQFSHQGVRLIPVKIASKGIFCEKN